MTDRCLTMSGRYRCSKPLNHPGECECEDMPPSHPVPVVYEDRGHQQAYLRGRLEGYAGTALDSVGRRLTPPLERRAGELDQAFRERMWRNVR